MRFAWLRDNTEKYDSIKQGYANPAAIIRLIYNAVFWVFLLPFITTMTYSTGFIVFTIIIFARLIANLYVNFADFKPQQYELFPFRLP